MWPAAVRLSTLIGRKKRREELIQLAIVDGEPSHVALVRKHAAADRDAAASGKLTVAVENANE